MFVGSINTQLRQFLGSLAPVLKDRTIVIGCSGNFTFETVIAATSKPRTVHSNDVSFYSCLAGQWLLNEALPFTIADPDYAWLDQHLTSLDTRLASIMVLLDMVNYHKRATAHDIRMWNNYRAAFADLVQKTTDKLAAVTTRISSFFPGDVQEHFERFADDASAIFFCFAPTYASGYERLYKRVDSIVRWDQPTYPVLDEKRRDQLLRWMQERDYLWYDDRLLPGQSPVLQQNRGRMKTVYLYSNVVGKPCVLTSDKPLELPKWPLIDEAFQITPDLRCQMVRIKTSQLVAYKEAFLSKDIAYCSGNWAFAVSLDGTIAGFLEFAPRHFRRDEMYIMADFIPPGSSYPRLSKLIVMMAIAGETHRLLERICEYYVRDVYTTAFTNRPVSMKYRGVDDVNGAPGRSQLGFTHVGNKRSHLGCLPAMFDSGQWLAHLLRILRHGEPALHRIHPFFEQEQLALGVVEHQGHVGLVVAHLAYPAGDLGESRLLPQVSAAQSVFVMMPRVMPRAVALVRIRGPLTTFNTHTRLAEERLYGALRVDLGVLDQPCDAFPRDAVLLPLQLLLILRINMLIRIRADGDALPQRRKPDLRIPHAQVMP
jgi:hypothetical protein